ncbi:unnamed protein product [Arctia plantaginis]|uniref:Uncharacterized protein n=1 Tax=Arctia plantaginis TaxID=874455 RepID=A0A8S0YWS6_ARCPL|nr:unnamed protein product [Arctia plantaginis]
MTAEPYTVQLDAETKATLKMYLFRDVQNVNSVRKNVVNGTWSCAVIKPSLILDPFQVAVAANKAAVAEKLNTMVTRTVFAELLYNLSITKNITQSLSMFGIDKNKNLLVCFIATEEKDPSSEIVPQIRGKLCLMSELKDLTNMENLKSAYQLEGLATDDDLLNVIVSRMVTKQFISY